MQTHQIIRRWCAHNRQIYAQGTCVLYTRVIWRLAEFLPENIKNTTPEHLERYVDKCLNKDKLSRRTVNAHIGTFKSFFRWVSENYDIDNPANKIKLLKPDPPHRRFISPEEYEKILDVCEEGESQIIKLLSHTGLRAAELQGLQISNLQGRSIRFCGKGRKERIAPLNQTAYDCLHENGKPSMNFLENLRRRNAVYALCRRLSIKAGIPIANPHAFRRFFGTELIKKGVSIYYISKMYGHASVQQTEQYLSCTANDLLGLTDCLD